MSKVIFNMTMSVDGFVAGPNDGPDNGLGDGGAGLFEWYFSGDTEVPIADGQMVLKVSAVSAAILREGMARLGAGVWGRRTFDIAHAWGGHPPGRPAFVVTHHPLPEWAGPGSPFTFVTDGVASAIRQAQAAAGGKDVVLCTASVLQQALRAGLVDELHLDVAPLVLGGGVRLFDHLGLVPVALECTRVVEAPKVTHLRYRVMK
jgi:dihydrofolate reductase